MNVLVTQNTSSVLTFKPKNWSRDALRILHFSVGGELDESGFFGGGLLSIRIQNIFLDLFFFSNSFDIRFFETEDIILY